MEYAILTLSGISHRRKTVADGFGSKAAAVHYARSNWAIVDLEHDALNPHCADFFTACGQVMSIEPATVEGNLT